MTDPSRATNAAPISSTKISMIWAYNSRSPPRLSMAASGARRGGVAASVGVVIGTVSGQVAESCAGALADMQGSRCCCMGMIDSEEQRKQIMLECLEYFTGLWNERVKAPPSNDLISMLAHGEATRNMGPVEYLGNLILLIVGGNDTTRNSISGGLLVAYVGLLSPFYLKGRTFYETAKLFGWRPPGSALDRSARRPGDHRYYPGPRQRRRVPDRAAGAKLATPPAGAVRRSRVSIAGVSTLRGRQAGWRHATSASASAVAPANTSAARKPACSPSHPPISAPGPAGSRISQRIVLVMRPSSGSGVTACRMARKLMKMKTAPVVKATSISAKAKTPKRLAGASASSSQPPPQTA